MTQDRRTQDTTQEATSSYQTVYRTPLINAQCQSIPINADQNSGIDPKYLSIKINADQIFSILLNKDQCRSMPINAGSSSIRH